MICYRQTNPGFGELSVTYDICLNLKFPHLDFHLKSHFSDKFMDNSCTQTPLCMLQSYLRQVPYGIVFCDHDCPTYTMLGVFDKFRSLFLLFHSAWWVYWETILLTFVSIILLLNCEVIKLSDSCNVKFCNIKSSNFCEIKFSYFCYVKFSNLCYVKFSVYGCPKSECLCVRVLNQSVCVCVCLEW